MSFVAIINSVENLRVLLAAGERPLAVGSWSTAVVDAARAAGLPAILEDDILDGPTRATIQAHAEQLARALVPATVPDHRRYADWAWWALEFPIMYVSAQGARTRLLLRALLESQRTARGIAHDTEGWLQGAVVVLAAGELGIPAFAFQPHQSWGESVTRRHDFALLPTVQDGWRPAWRGTPLRRTPQPNVLMIHTNEIAHLVGALVNPGARHFTLVQDARDPWPKPYTGQQVDAVPQGGLLPLEAPEWPAGARGLAKPWERELLDHLFVTWQAHLRDQHAWARAAYDAGRVRLFLGGSDHLPQMRARLLACRELGIPTVLVQHGAFLALQPGRYAQPNHRYADHNLVWSRAAARELATYLQARGESKVIGWPQAGVAAAKWRRARAAASRHEWVVLPSGTGTPADAISSYRVADDFLRDVFAAVRAVRPDAPLVVKCHPFSDNVPQVEALCAEYGLPNARVVTGLDPWRALEHAELAIAGVSSAAFSAAAMEVPLVVHSPGPNRWFGQFADVTQTRTREELAAVLADPAGIRDARSLTTYAREDARAGRRVVAALRGLLHPGRRLAPPRPRTRVERRRAARAR